MQIVSLRNPCTEAPSRYLYAKHLNRIYEILNFAEEPRSWFIDDMACADGSLFLTTALDPLFFSIYYLRLNASERCVPFDQAVIDDKFPNTNLLPDLISEEQLSMVSPLICVADQQLEILIEFTKCFICIAGCQSERRKIAKSIPV